MAKKLKDLVHNKVAPKASFGTNPSDPWSTKSNIDESASLNAYLMSRGIDPNHVSMETKVSYAKSSQFIKWKQDHTFKEGVDKKDTVTFDIPLLIRVLELAREDVKSDMDLHRIVERLINIRDKGMLTMDDYDFIAHIKESVEGMALEESRGHKIIATKLSALDRWRNASFARDAEAKKYDDEAKARQARGEEPDVKGAIDRLEKALKKEEVEKKQGMSKSARMIKALYKHHKMVKEDLTDTEKEDKSVETYGKKPKMKDIDDKVVQGEKKPQAAAVMSGGTTLTGEKRDTIEIDPAMRNRPGQPDATKKQVK